MLEIHLLKRQDLNWNSMGAAQAETTLSAGHCLT